MSRYRESSPEPNRIGVSGAVSSRFVKSKVYDVDPKLISRTQQWLAGQQQADGSWKPDTSFIHNIAQLVTAD
jgi:hypothetical protein